MMKKNNLTEAVKSGDTNKKITIKREFKKT